MAPTLTPNPALHVTEDHRIYMDESPSLSPGPNDCVVHVQANGICGYAAVRALVAMEDAIDKHWRYADRTCIGTDMVRVLVTLEFTIHVLIIVS